MLTKFDEKGKEKSEQVSKSKSDQRAVKKKKKANSKDLKELFKLSSSPW